jgi:Zn-dependent metalloprotease
VLLSGATQAEPLSVEEGALGGVLEVLNAPSATEPPVLHQTEEGFIRFLGAPPGGHFIAREDGKSVGAAGTATTFFVDHGKAFGALSSSTNFKTGTVLDRGTSSFVRLEQYYGDLPVFGGQAVVQVGDDKGVRNVMSDIMRDTRALDDGTISLSPAISSGQALAAAAEYFSRQAPELTAADFRGGAEASLEIFRPSVLGIDGQTRLVWHLRIVASGANPVDNVVLVDAHTGQVAFYYSMLEHALNRQVFDADGSFSLPDDPARSEGEAAIDNDAVDDVYDFLGDTYNFFFDEHGHDSFDGNGSPIVATVNVPFLNACWGCSLDPGSIDEEPGDITEMLFGPGFELDDIVAHEMTHGVTQFTSDLIYAGYSGAINESFSDMWGEWVDMTNGSINDIPRNRWIVGEEFDPSLLILFGVDPSLPGVRNMKDPTLKGDPDRLGSPLLINPNGFFDNGGVHINSGIGNKLCYLLTDGDTFNGYTVEGLGVSLAADLFFGTQFLLTPAADYNDLYLALGASAVDLGLSFDERLNIANAGRAVEIVPADLQESGLRDLRALSTEDTSGNPVITLSWTNPDPELFTEVVLIRNPTRFPQNLSDGEELARGTINQYLDRAVVAGETYFYSVIADLTTGLPQLVSTSATAGESSDDILTESFGDLADFSGRNAVDLSFSQLLFTPVGRPTTGLGSYENYDAVYLPNAFSLPVAREDSEGRARDITSPQDSGVLISLGSHRVPFFGQPYSQIFAAANGYIAFQGIGLDDPLNYPSLDSHFAIPRLSYFFAGTGIFGDRIASYAGGSMWYRLLDDRFVLTYENVPQFNFLSPLIVGSTSTIQVEMYYSGHIRITYLDAVATKAIIGLSDGRGVPVDPADLFPDVISVGGLADLSELPSENDRLSIDPVTAVVVDAGELASFNVTISAPAGNATDAELTATWDGPSGVPFADNGDGTGTFFWETALDDDGTYLVRVTATLGDEVAYQDVVVQIGDVVLLPEAVNLEIITGESGEDPGEDRAVADESSLLANYTYFHPQQTGDVGLFDEGTSIIYWYRNDQIVTSLTNRGQVSPQATRGGDIWYFGVVPVTLSGIAGAVTYSPKVTISGIPEIVSISPPMGSIAGGERVRIIGARLSAPTSVTFGGVAVTSIRAISANELEVTTPLHASGAVDVVVNTIAGPGILHNGFTYVGEDALVEVTDVNNDGKIDALDVQIVVNAVLRIQEKSATLNPDANRDGQVNASDIQVVVNKALHR